MNETERVETGIQPWHVSMTVPTEHLTEPRTIYRTLEDIGYDRAFSFEAKHDPFVPIAVAGEHTTSIELGTAVAIAFARTPMTLANVGWDLQTVTGGRFTLGLGSQVRPHIEQRFSMAWSCPAQRTEDDGGRRRGCGWFPGAPGQHPPLVGGDHRARDRTRCQPRRCSSSRGTGTSIPS